MRERVLTIVTWNLQGHAGIDAAGVTDRLCRFDADVVALQEVPRRGLSGIARALGVAHARWSLKHWPIRSPAEGLGLLSRLPVTRLRTTTVSRGAPWWSWRRRIVQVATLDWEGVALVVANTHLASGRDPARPGQAQRVLAALGREYEPPGPVLVVGDLNEHPRGPALQVFDAAGLRDAWPQAHAGVPDPPTNWQPGPRHGPPHQRLDYILLSAELQAVDARVPAFGDDDFAGYPEVSDHLPVVARLRLPVP